MKTPRNTLTIGEAEMYMKEVKEALKTGNPLPTPKQTTLTQEYKKTTEVKQAKTVIKRQIKKPALKVIKAPTKPKYDLLKAKIEVFNLVKYELEKQNIQPFFDEKLKRLYRLLTAYFLSDSSFEKDGFTTSKGTYFPYNLTKGILVIGNTGRSKTFAFEKIFNKFCGTYVKEKTYQMVNSYDVQIAFEVEGTKAIQKFEKQNFSFDRGQYYNMYIDEIGVESKEVKFFGNVSRPIEMLLHIRHKVMTSSGAVTHATTNLNIKDFDKFYGPRIFSRIWEMFNIIDVTGNDLRINTNVKKHDKI